MKNKRSKGNQSSDVLSLMDTKLSDSNEYKELSDFISSLDENQVNYSPEQIPKAQTMVNRLLNGVCQFVLSKTDSNVVQLLNQSLSFFPKSSFELSEKNDNLLSPHGALNCQNDESDIVKNLNEQDDAEILDRIAQQLDLDNPANEVELIKSINERLEAADKLREDIVEAFDLPKNTHPEYIVTALTTKIEEKEQNNSSEEKLRIQLSQMSAELAEAQNQMRNLRDNEQQQELTILELQNKITGLQNQEAINDINTEIVDKRIDIEKCKAEINELQNDNMKLVAFKQKSQKRITQLQKLVKDETEKNKALIKKLEDAQQKLKEKEQAPPPKPEEKDDELQYPFDQLLSQYESQSKEIADDALVRMELLDAIQKLTTINSILDQRLEQATKRISDLEKQRDQIIKDEAEAKKKNAPQTGNASTQTQIAQQPKKDQKLKQQTKDSKKTTSQDDDESDSEDEKEFVDESLIGSIKSAVQAVNDELKLSLNGILDNTDFTVSKRVLSTISSLVGSIHNTNVYEEGDDVLEKRNRLLLCTVGSLVKFIDTMINSEEIRSWALSKYSFEESQDLLTKQSQAISKFMNENCIEYMEDQDTILSAFVEQNDPLQLEKTVKAILSSMPSVKTNEGKDLLILLHQSLAAGLLLQAYASKVTNKWSEQGNEIETLQNHIKELEEANEKYAEDLKQEIEKTQESIEKYRAAQEKKAQLEISDTPEASISESAINAAEEEDLNEEETKASLNNSLSSAKADEEYIRELQQKLDETRKNLEKYKNCVKSVKNALRTEVNNGNQSTVIINSLRNVDEIDSDHEDAFIQTMQSAHSVKTETEVKQIEPPHTETHMKETEETEEININKQLEELTEENRNLNEQIKKLHQKAADKFNKLQESFRISKEEMKDSFAKKQRALIRHHKALAQTIEAEKRNKAELEKTIQELNEKINDLQRQNKQLQIDYKLINAKLSSRDEEIKRDKAIADSQWKLKQFNIQANAQTTIDRYKQEIDSKLTDFLISVVNLFKNHVDVNQTLTCETVYQILSHVAEKLEHNTKQANEMEKVNEVMKFESNSNPQKVLEDLKNENSNFATQIQSLTNENASLKKELKNKNSALISRAPAKEWEEWAIPIYRKITNSSAKKPAAYLLRRMIQNALEPILNDDSSNPNRSSNSASISQVNNERSSRQDIKVCNLCFVAIAAIRLQKLINIFESNQDITKTKFKVGSGASIVPASQKFVRKSVESHNEM